MPIWALLTEGMILNALKLYLCLKILKTYSYYHACYLPSPCQVLSSYISVVVQAKCINLYIIKENCLYGKNRTSCNVKENKLMVIVSLSSFLVRVFLLFISSLVSPPLPVFY